MMMVMMMMMMMAIHILLYISNLDADADARSMTPSRNTRSYTLRSVPSSPGRSFLAYGRGTFYAKIESYANSSDRASL